MKKIMFMAAIAMGLTVFSACTIDELKTSPDEGILTVGKADVYVEDYYLAFKNMNAADSVMTVLSKRPNRKRCLGTINGDQKCRAEFDKLFDECEELASKEEFLKFKSKYADQLKFNEMDETDCSIDYPLSSKVFSPVLNSNRVFKVGLIVLNTQNGIRSYAEKPATNGATQWAQGNLHPTSLCGWLVCSQRAKADRETM